LEKTGVQEFTIPPDMDLPDMNAICLHNKSRIEAFLRKNVYLHIYSIGDLDDFFWPDTVWYGWEKGSEIQAVALLYTASQEPTLLAVSEQEDVM